MKIDRRSFLSLGLGAAAGTALSPLPWKLTDDISIWTQMWPWTPVPQDGETTYVNSACALCPGGCGITVRKVEERAIKIEGMDGHPVNDGGICPLGLSGLQLLYGPRRIQSPMKRENGKWVKISWKEAITLVSDKIAALRANGEPQAVGCISGFQKGATAQLLERFLLSLGSPNYMSIPSAYDAYEQAVSRMHGRRMQAGIDVEQSNFILSFSCGVIEGWWSPVRMIRAHSIWKEKNAKLVQMESRLSNTAAKADKWIPMNPGAEAALALGIAAVIIKESLYDKTFIENYAKGFDKFQQMVLNDYSPESVASLTGVDKSVIEGLARDFAAASRPVALYGRGAGSQPGALFEAMAVHALNALVGAVNKPGGVWAIEQTDEEGWPAIQMDEIAKKGVKSPRIDGVAPGSENAPNSLISRFSELAVSGKHPLKALFIAGANPCYSLPDSNAVKAAFEKIPFIVSFSSYLDETTEYAHLALPDHTYLEKYQDVQFPRGSNKPVTTITRPVVSPLCNTKNIGDTIIAIASKIGGGVAESFPWDDYETCLRETFGDDWDTLEEEGFKADSDFTPEPWEKAFQDDPGKLDFAAAGLLEGNGQIALEGDGGSYPLVLIPYDTLRLSGGYIGDPPFVIKTVEDTVLKKKDSFVEVNPETARGLGVKNGGYAILATPKGQVKVRVNHYSGIKPGIIAMPRGLGHGGGDEYLAEKGVNVNELIGPAPDPQSGFDGAWGIRAKLTRA